MKTNNLAPIPTRFNDLRALLLECYNLSAEVPKMIDVYNEHAIQVVTSCLFIKILNTTRAILLLFENNLLSEVHVLLRHQMEAMFVLKACYEDKEFLQEYINSDTLCRLKLGNVISQKPDIFSMKKEYDVERIKRLKDELKSIVDENGIREIKIEELARRAKLTSYYDTAYRVLSNIVHVGVKSLDDYLVLDDNGKVKKLSIYPYQEDIPTLFISAIEINLIAIKCIANVFEINIKDKITTLGKRLSESQGLTHHSSPKISHETHDL